LKEFKKSTPTTRDVYLCHRSQTFENLWKKHKAEIKDLAAIFLKEKEINPSEIYTMDLCGGISGSCLLYGKDVKAVDKAKIDFLHWGAKRNQEKKLRRI
jgi:hypothetical protein